MSSINGRELDVRLLGGGLISLGKRGKQLALDDRPELLDVGVGIHRKPRF